ncbi:hypothetical protein PAEPH01_0692 [Pancytospora epiphaga]|nr:hypothetical protein PAEPH01_0692 [Pancytospora epiphaga]
MEVEKKNNILKSVVRETRTTKDARHLLHLLAEKDFYVIFFKLRNERFKNPSVLNASALEKLFEYIEAYINFTHIIDTDFSTFMNRFLMNVKPESIRLHIQCFSCLKNVDLNYLRKYFGYSEIYQTFKEAISGLFTYYTPSKYLVLLIRLLDNNQLVYKNMLPVILRIKSYIEKDVVDKNIGACCSALNSVASCCPEYFNETLVASLLGYLGKLLHTPQNYLFLSGKDVSAILETFNTLGSFEFQGTVTKNNTVGLLRECVGKIEEFRSSSVYEESQVVLHMTEIIPTLFNMCLKQGLDKFTFINPDFLDIKFGKLKQQSFYNKKQLNKSELDVKMTEGEHKKKIKPQFDKWQARFITAKYKFFNIAHSYIAAFKMEVFYQDLVHVENVVELFMGMNDLKKKLDWSDIITYACHSSYKPSYMPILFDEHFTKEPKHIEYIRIFFENISDTPEYIIYFTYLAVTNRYNKILMDIYLHDRTNDPVAIKVRNIILKYLSNYQNNDYEEPPVSDNEKYLDKIKRRLKEELISSDKDNDMDKIVKECMDKLTFCKVCPALAALFTVFIANDIRVSSHISICNYIRRCLAIEGGNENIKVNYVAIAAAILVKSGASIFDVTDRIENYYEVLIALLSYKGGNMKDKKHLEKIECEGFCVIFNCTLEQLAELGAISGYGDNKLEDSKYWQEYKRMNKLVKFAK